MPGLTVAALALFAIAGSDSTASAQGLTFVNRADTQRKPEDVALVTGGGIAVVRCVYSPDDNPIQPHPDEIMVIRTGGPQAGQDVGEFVHVPNASYHGLTLPTGASDLVAATTARSVLIGHRHEGPESGWTTYIDVLDITGTYGVTSYGMPGPQFLKSFAFAGAGGAHDVAISPDGAWAVVNGRNFIHVIDLDADAPSGTIPNPNLALTVSTGPSDPSFLRDSVVMTRTAGGTMHAVVLTRKISGAISRAVAFVIALSDAAPPTASAPLELDPGSPSVNHPPHDIAISPDDRLAFVTARGAVGLIDLAAGTMITDVATQSGTFREYNDMADSVELSATQAVVIARTDIVPPSMAYGWRVDVYDIAPGANGLTHRQAYTNSTGGYPHDLALGPAGDVATVRTEQAILVLEGLAQSGGTIAMTAVPSATGPLTRFNDNNDSIVITPSWLAYGLPGGPPGGGIVQFVAAIARHTGGSSLAARVDVVNLKDGSLGVDHSEIVDGAHWPNPSVEPGSLALARGGRAVVLHSRAKPDDTNEAGPTYDEADGVDTTYLLLGAYPTLTSNYEGWGYLQAASDSLALERGVAMFLSNLVPGNVGFVQTMEVE